MLHPQRQRIHAIDIVRGIVMLIMALDHVRDFFHITAITDDPTNLATTTPALFFTRWITHFCAPAFVFLSGTSAWLASQRKTKKETSLFLIKRGLWLVVVELVVITFALTYNPFYNFFILQVIWAIGWSMVLLGCLLLLGRPAIVVTGLVLVFFHNITNYLALPQTGAAHVWWSLLLTTPGTVFPLDDTHLVLAAYAILPWTGIMLLGYWFGSIYTTQQDATKRRKYILVLGASVTLLFLVLRLINEYGDPNPWSAQQDAVYTLLSFFNTTKYPPSLIYSSMTLGPTILLLAALEKATGRFARMAEMYGRVPFFYYVLHFFLIHTVLVVVYFLSGYGAAGINPPGSPFFFRPADFGFSLPVVYLIWLSVIVILYWPCKWFDRYRSTHRWWWLSYL